MPTYVYFCSWCGWKCEFRHSIKESPTVICEKCKGDMQIKITGGGYINFVGPGFFINDYPKKEGS